MATATVILLAWLAVFGLVQQPRPAVVQSVDLAVPVPPIPFRQGDRDHLVYELHITNFQQVDVVLSAVRVDGPRGMLAEYRDAELHRLITRPGFRFDHPAPQVVAPGARAIVNIWMPMGNGVAAATAIRHAVDLTVQRK